MEAWYQAQSTVSIAAKTGSGSVTVATSKQSVGTLNIPMVITASANVSGLGLAHYNGTGEKKGTPYLTTGYVDLNNTFQDLGYGDTAGTPNYGNFTPAITKLQTQLSFTIAVDYTDTHWDGDHDADGTDVTKWTADGGEVFGKAYVLGELDKVNVNIGVKRSTDSRVCFYKTDAKTNDPEFADGVTMMTGTYSAYAKINPSVINLGADGGASVAVGQTELYLYVCGKKDSSDNNIDTVSPAGGVDLVLVAA